MNIRISSNQIRYRITRSELEQLLTENLLTLAVTIGVAKTVYTLSVNDNTQPLSITVEGNGWELSVNRATLQNFIATLPSREGIEHEYMAGEMPITLVLEVDVRRRA